MVTTRFQDKHECKILKKKIGSNFSEEHLPLFFFVPSATPLMAGKKALSAVHVYDIVVHDRRFVGVPTAVVSFPCTLVHCSVGACMFICASSLPPVSKQAAMAMVLRCLRYPARRIIRFS